MAYASTVDLDEAYHAGQHGRRVGRWRRNGQHVDDPAGIPAPRTAFITTKCRSPKSPIANGAFPASWISENGYDVTDEFVRYAQPLVGEGMVSLPMIGGRQRMTRLKPLFADQKLPPYVPEAERRNKTEIVSGLRTPTIQLNCQNLS